MMMCIVTQQPRLDQRPDQRVEIVAARRAHLAGHVRIGEIAHVGAQHDVAHLRPAH